jgi:hypothetical protein
MLLVSDTVVEIPRFKRCGLWCVFGWPGESGWPERVAALTFESIAVKLEGPEYAPTRKYKCRLPLPCSLVIVC